METELFQVVLEPIQEEQEHQVTQDLDLVPEATLEPRFEITEVAKEPKEPKKRTKRSIQEKYDILMDLEKKMKRKDVMRKYGISSSGHLTHIIKEKDKIVKEFKSGSTTLAKMRRPKNKEFEEKVLEFVKGMQEMNVPLIRSIIQSQARKISRHLGCEVKASDGWLSHFLKRNKIVYHDAKTKFEGEKVDWKNRRSMIDLTSFPDQEDEPVIEKPSWEQVAKAMSTISRFNFHSNFVDPDKLLKVQEALLLHRIKYSYNVLRSGALTSTSTNNFVEY